MARRLARRTPEPRHATASKRSVARVSKQIARVVARTTSHRRQDVRLFSHVAFVVVVGLALGFSWRDSAPGSDGIDAYGGASAYLASSYETRRDLRAPAPFVVIAGPAPSQAPVPTAPPVQLLIPSLDVHRAVEGVGVNRAGVLSLPVNAWNAGWYTGGPVPGAPGDAVIEGHAGYPGQPMIFGRLIMLKPGDRIIVVLADRSRQLFLVDSITTVPVGSAPPGMAEPYGPPRLTLVTCTGHFDQNSYSYSRRLVLEASYAGLA